MISRIIAAARAGVRHPGVLVTTAVALVGLGFAASVDFPRTARGFKGDEATYYSLTYSIARDRDFTFQRQDLIRVWEEFPGPEGIFLKRGSLVDFRRSSSFPFFTVERTPDPARGRLFYGKSYIYPLFAAPFVWLFGTNGFLVFHALLLALNVGLAYRFLAARGSTPGLAAGFACVFLFASVTPVYFIWLAPELFNVTLVMTAFFLWSYKRIAPAADRDTRLERFLRSPRSDYAALVLLGIATFSKPTHILLTLPIGATALFAREWRRLAMMVVCFSIVVAGLFALNAYATGEFNYQGGERKTFYGSTGFPFANTWETFDNRGVSVSTGAVPLDILFHRDTAPVLAWNVLFFSTGRYSGLLPYFFPGLVAVALFLARRSERRPWQVWVGAGLVLGAVALMAYMPYTYSGGGGPVGNRYFVSFYPLFLFLMPAVRSAWPAVVGLAVGALFIAKILLNPFYASFNPGQHAEAGPLRWLPIERTLLNDLPVSADPARSRRSLGGSPPVQAYFVDENAFPPEGDGFWVKGESRADVLLRAPVTGSEETAQVPLRIRALRIEVTNGGVSNSVVVATSWDRAHLTLAPGEVRVVQLSAGAGVPYRPSRFPSNYIYSLSVSASAGFVPFLNDLTSSDSRYLGVLVRVVPIYYCSVISASRARWGPSAAWSRARRGSNTHRRARR